MNRKKILIAKRSACRLGLLGFTLSTVAALAQPGSLDTSFNPGTGVDLVVNSVALQSDGKVLISGHFSSFNNTARTNAARLNSNGGLDTTFDPGSVMAGSSYVEAGALPSSGKVLLGGSFNTAVSANLAALTTSGVLDTNFTVQTDGAVNALLLQTNGQIIIGGFFSYVNGASRSGIARLSAAGAVDATFNPVLSGGFSTINALALQADGRIVIGGSFTGVNTTSTTNIARLNTDGNVDTSFQPVAVGGNLSSLPVFYALAIDSLGRVVVGGDFATVNGQVRTNIVRLNSNGSLDGTFSPAAGTDFPVYAVVAQNDNQVALGGGFNYVNSVASTNIARLNPDGSFDTTFNPGGAGADGIVYGLALQPDGKILIGGAFASYNGSSRGGIARLNGTTTVARPQLVNPLLSNGWFRVSVATATGMNYTLQFKTSLTGTNWTSLPVLAGNGNVMILSDPSATNSSRFYRVQVQ